MACCTGQKAMWRVGGSDCVTSVGSPTYAVAYKPVLAYGNVGRLCLNMMAAVYIDGVASLSTSCWTAQVGGSKSDFFQ